MRHSDYPGSARAPTTGRTVQTGRLEGSRFASYSYCALRTLTNNPSTKLPRNSLCRKAYLHLNPNHSSLTSQRKYHRSSITAMKVKMKKHALVILHLDLWKRHQFCPGLQTETTPCTAESSHCSEAKMPRGRTMLTRVKSWSCDDRLV